MEIYFDNSATTRVCKSAVDIMIKAMQEDYGNPSSKHIMGMKAEQYVKDAAKIIAGTLKADEKNILFTSGGTESNNMALIGCCEARSRIGKHIIITSIEHPAVYAPAGYLESLGYEVTVLPVDSSGHISLKALEDSIREDTVIVSTMYVNNEVGAVEPIEEIAKIIHKKNPETYYHVDAIQAYGKYNIYPKRLGIDLMSASGHKFHGPKGVGFLYIDKKVRIKPIMYGGGQQRGLRSGTINVPAIAGMGAAAKYIYTDFDNKISSIIKLKDHIIDELSKEEKITINSYKGNDSAPHIISVSIEDVRAEVMLHALEERGIYVSSGSACSSNHPGISGTLKGIGIDDKLLDSTIRISICEDNTIEEADICIAAIKELSVMLRRYTRR